MKIIKFFNLILCFLTLSSCTFFDETFNTTLNDTNSITTTSEFDYKSLRFKKDNIELYLGQKYYIEYNYENKFSDKYDLEINNNEIFYLDLNKEYISVLNFVDEFTTYKLTLTYQNQIIDELNIKLNKSDNTNYYVEYDDTLFKYEETKINVLSNDDIEGINFSYNILKDDEKIEIDEQGVLKAFQTGETYFSITINSNIYLGPYKVNILDNLNKDFYISIPYNEIGINQEVEISVFPESLNKDFIKIKILNGNEYIEINDFSILGKSEGSAMVFATYNDVESNVISFNIVEYYINISVDKNILLKDESTQLHIDCYPNDLYEEIKYITNTQLNCQLKIDFENNIISGINFSTESLLYYVTLFVSGSGIKSNEIEIFFIEEKQDPTSISISTSKNEINLNESVELNVTTYPNDSSEMIELDFISGSQNIKYKRSIDSNNNVIHNICGLSGGESSFRLKIGETYSNIISLFVYDEYLDPYLNVSKSDFYLDYSSSTSFNDSYYRSKHYLLSGDNQVIDQNPTIEQNQPIENNKLIKNSSSYYSFDKNKWNIVDKDGIIVKTIYKCGAYITLEEVAAYLYAFNDIPTNYVSNKNTEPTESNWGEYLRLNHSYFSGDTSKYPYEPELPRISGINDGDLKYYEVDIGTTGTDCDPKYTSALYNNGSYINRGAARIVYTRYYNDGNNTEITEFNDRYLFYTNNHYNDFREYLNYYNGWGEIFGNITGGGEISSRKNYNPTKYIEVILKEFN